MKPRLVLPRAVLVLLTALFAWLGLEVGEMTTGVGLPDWGRIKKGAAVSPLADLGELAARLGSINTFDRRGDTVWMDDFEEGIIKWNTETGGAGGGVASSAAYARNGGYSAELTAGSDGALYAQIVHGQSHSYVSKFGLELSFSLDSSLNYIEVTFVYLDGTTQFVGRVFYYRASGEIKYLASDGVATLLDTVTPVGTLYHRFTPMKLVIDPVGEKWVRFLFGGNEYDMADIALYQIAATAFPRLGVVVYIKGESGYNAKVYLDDVIITQNEP